MCAVPTILVELVITSLIQLTNNEMLCLSIFSLFIPPCQKAGKHSAFSDSYHCTCTFCMAVVSCIIQKNVGILQLHLITLSVPYRLATCSVTVAVRCIGEIVAIVDKLLLFALSIG